jgi:hypothetical protein
MAKRVTENEDTGTTYHDVTNPATGEEGWSVTIRPDMPEEQVQRTLNNWDVDDSEYTPETEVEED